MLLLAGFRRLVEQDQSCARALVEGRPALLKIPRLMGQTARLHLGSAASARAVASAPRPFGRRLMALIAFIRKR